ncbi:DUF4382 domain-containing protein [Alteromonas aestuariivivens]|uniref:DUF4382 domain-containing protein n=1 Tax=Alteromonas aestuariivivens TaxID=1938339 RepID=UPI001FEAACE3|nr:DUF4382 domain-containing protein [Alteromonas aestuariivivens]
MLISNNKQHSAKNSKLAKIFSRTALVAAVSALAACGGGSDSPAPTTSVFSLGVSDAPVDAAQEVNVYFDEVVLVGNGDPITFNVTDENGDPRKIDLLTLQGENVAGLVTEEEIPAGEYSQLRLVVTDDSYVVMDDGTYSLKVPSGQLKLDGFTAQPGFDAAYTVEFDLRKSMVDPVGQEAIYLKPRGVRLVLNDDVGTLSGTVDEALITAEECSVKTDANSGNAVYVYSGADIATEALGDDADAGVDDTEARPFTIATVNLNETTMAYEFNVGFVPQGDYTVAFNCLAEFDQPETDEDENVSVAAVQTVTVVAKETTSIAMTAVTN